MKRLCWLPGVAVLTGCMSDEFSQSGASYAACSGIINIGCNATTRNLIMPSPDEALALALALALLAAILCIIYLAKQAGGG